MIEKLYKAFNENTTCLNFKYPTDGTWTKTVQTMICRSGYHACRKLDDVLRYYSTPDSIWEIEGDVQDSDGDKVVCSTIRLIRKLEFKDIADTLDIIQYNTVGWFWEYFSPETKERYLIRLFHSLYSIAQYARISEEDYEWFIEEVTSNHRKQDPWFYEKVAKYNPEKVVLFISEAPELVDKCREEIRNSVKINNILDIDAVRDLFTIDEIKEKVLSSETMSCSMNGSKWVLHNIPFTQDELLNVWSKILFKREIYNHELDGLPIYKKIIDDHYILPFLEKGDYSILNQFKYCTDELLKTIEYRAYHLVICRANPRARMEYFMRTHDTSVFHYDLKFETAEEIEEVNAHMAMVLRNNDLAEVIAHHPLTSVKVLKRISKSKRWEIAARVARIRLAQLTK